MVSCSLQTHIMSNNVFIACQSSTGETEDLTILKASLPPPDHFQCMYYYYVFYC